MTAAADALFGIPIVGTAAVSRPQKQEKINYTPI